MIARVVAVVREGLSQSEAIRKALVETARRRRDRSLAAEAERALPASFRPEVSIRGVQTRVLVEQIGAVDKSRLGDSAGVLSWEELSEVDHALGTVLGLAR
jgi:mRNA-degrading endonuclease toxin of MazEF toxin-antitoxin module